MEDIEDISKMKVADLKKHLKSKGLPVTGNKTELVERLQKALESDENHATLESSGGVDDEEFDEEEILGGEEELDDSKITQEEEAAALAGNLKVKEDALLLTEAQPEKKKISLKRSEPSLSSTTEAEASAGQDETVTSNSNSSTNLNNDKENSIASIEEPKHKVIKLSGVTAENALEARAKKFATVAGNDSEETRKLARAARFGIDATLSPSTTNKRAPKLSMEVGDTSLEKLKKRAERFGEVTSKSLSKVEEIEKRKQRQNRFSSADSDSSKAEKKSDSGTEEEPKKIQNGTKVAITAPADEDDAKKKRAKRFAAAAAE